MKIYDISQAVFGCRVYQGDPIPQKTAVCSMQNGDLYNLTQFSMCAHNGTHIDAPLHFFKNGEAVDKIALKKCVGYAFVYEFNGELSANDALKIIGIANQKNPESAKRILLKGNALVTEESAKVFAQNLLLIGVELQSVGAEESPKKVHEILLEKGVVLLEGLVLNGVCEGEYLLCAQPLNLNGCEGAPCRAILIK